MKKPNKPSDHAVRPKRQPKTYLQFAGFQRGLLKNKQLTKWDSRRDAIHSTLRRIMRNEPLHVQFRKYFIQTRVA